MASKVNSYKHRQTFINTTFESSIDSTAVEEKLFAHSVEEDDGHAVFICGKCKLPVGDSMSWDGSEASEEGHNQIRLKRVTDNVVVGEDTRLHEVSKKSPW
ncbi:protein Mis18-alpha [Notothenia coriiceps]|uniref:Protein yippee-like n=1 Tax=Notothenia coriiceps TaxID=8208 RepID=A0A6I9P4L5_9TELE|nr:PREDICTED: protein Mis18-alpha-like [Notothenia coriiceps]